MRTHSKKRSESKVGANMGKSLLEIDTLLLPMAASNHVCYIAAISLAIEYKASEQSPLALL
jgi:hypothetical protein